MSFGDFLGERVFKPLAMNHTIAYENGRNEVAGRAYGHTRIGQRLARNRPEFHLGDSG